MKHGLKLRKLQRTPSHRWALLRNLVSALLHHESIKTTLPKAKEAARLAEKIITMGKQNTDPSRRAAMAFLMPSHHYPSSASGSSSKLPPQPMGYPARPGSSSSEYDPETFEPPTSILPKLFDTLATRYASRPGGYTRIHRFGRRQGDNAPHAILELVDGPHDLKFEMAARAVGRERAQASGGIEVGVRQRDKSVGGLREKTAEIMQKVLRYRGDAEREQFETKAAEWGNILRAEEKALGGHRKMSEASENLPKETLARTPKPYQGRRYMAGERMSGMIGQTGLGLARGPLSRRSKAKSNLPRFLGERTPETVQPEL